jgi:isopenicillin-N epimerase
MTSLSRSDPSPNRIDLRNAAGAFELDPAFTHLNHGSYGAVPREVRLVQDRWRAAIERNPTGFYNDEYPALIRSAAEGISHRLGGETADWVFCENATAAVNAVLQSLDLRPDDEILTTSHAYGAVAKAMALTAGRRGAKLRIAEVSPFVNDDQEVVDAISQQLGPRTRLLVVDHITSQTATIFPVRRIAEAAQAAGVPLLVDGAHAPGQIPLDVPSLGADWYTGNAHKWLFAPRGCGLLWTRPTRQAITRPAVLSHGTDQGYANAFDWIGTRDPSPWLSFESAAKAHDGFGGEGLMVRNRMLAAEGGQEIAVALGARIAGAAAMRGSMASLVLKHNYDSHDGAAAYRRALSSEYRIMAPVYVFAGVLWLRISAQIYNSTQDYRRLASACRDLLG